MNRHGLDEREANGAAEALAAKTHETGYGLYMLSKDDSCWNFGVGRGNYL